jgi:glycerophosphoryl diester phosphodiesterase
MPPIHSTAIGSAALALLLCAALPQPASADDHSAWRRHDGERTPKPLIVGHRGGATGYLPEHTLENYALGIAMGADYVEPDLVRTKDGHLIARHEPNLIGTTNVASIQKFADRRRFVSIDGAPPEEGFFASDFTLAEIRELRAIERVAYRDHSFDGRYKIPTLEEVIEFVKRKSDEEGRVIGIYPETKHPTYHQSLGLPLEDKLLEVLTKAGWNHRGAPVFIQSFETANLRYLRTKTKLKLVQLVDANDVNPDGTLDFTPPFDRPYDWTVSGRAGRFSDLLTPQGLAEVASYADGVGPWKPYLISSRCKATTTDPNSGAVACADVTGDGLVDNRDRELLPPSAVLANAHKAGLLVHPYTFRSEQSELSQNYGVSADPTNPIAKGFSPITEYTTFYELGVDGLFSDFADDAFAARAKFLLKQDPRFADCLVGRKGCRKPRDD